MDDWMVSILYLGSTRISSLDAKVLVCPLLSNRSSGLLLKWYSPSALHLAPDEQAPITVFK